MYGGGYNDLVFFVSALSGQLTSQGVASLGAFPAFKSAPEASLGVFSTFGSAPETSPAYFQPSKVLPKPRSTCFQPSGGLPRLPRCIFTPQKCSRSLAWSVFGFQKYSRSLTRRVFNLRELSRGFPGALSAFGSTPETSPAYFQPSKVLPRLSSQCCALLTEFSSKTRALFLSQGVTLRQKHFQFSSNKNHHKLRSFYET